MQAEVQHLLEGRGLQRGGGGAGEAAGGGRSPLPAVAAGAARRVVLQRDLHLPAQRVYVARQLYLHRRQQRLRQAGKKERMTNDIVSRRI